MIIMLPVFILNNILYGEIKWQWVYGCGTKLWDDRRSDKNFAEYEGESSWGGDMNNFDCF